MPPHTPDVAYLFDVDGVLTAPETKQVEHPALFDELLKRLQAGLPVGLNTGRSLEFVIENILVPLKARVSDVSLLQNVFAVGEKGAAWIVYDEKGEYAEQIDTSISVPLVIQQQARLITQRPEYASMMFYDETKRTMVSIELHPPEQRPGISLEDFHRAQRELVDDLRALIIRHGFEKQLKVDPTRIATDIENVHVGKARGARKLIELLEERAIRPRHYLAFGDSISDYEMYEELLRQRKKAKFIFVGGRQQIANKPQEGVLYTTAHVDKGTLEFLQNEKN